MTLGLVMAGGGIAGIAWEIGLLSGIADVEPDAVRTLLAADLVIGTSAGSVVGTYVASAVDLSRAYDEQVNGPVTELPIDVDLPALIQRLGAAARQASDPDDALRRIGRIALDTDAVDEASRRTAIAARLDGLDWPDRTLRITAVDTSTGRLRVFDRDSRVPLLDAVGASCAVPGVWPPVTIGDTRYMDGGARSNTNADLATGVDRVVVITPAPPGLDAMSVTGGLQAELDSLGVPSLVLAAGPEAQRAFGTNPLSAATRAPSAIAGRDQGRTVATDLAAFLSTS